MIIVFYSIPSRERIAEQSGSSVMQPQNRPFSGGIDEQHNLFSCKKKRRKKVRKYFDTAINFAAELCVCFIVQNGRICPIRILVLLLVLLLLRWTLRQGRWFSWRRLSYVRRRLDLQAAEYLLPHWFVCRPGRLSFLSVQCRIVLQQIPYSHLGCTA